MAGMQMIYGNPDLKPEKSNNYNLTFFPKPRWWNADLNGVMVTIRSRSPSRLDN